MNSITRSTLHSFRSFIRSVAQMTYSTAVNVCESPLNEEPDKLYKTIEIEMRANERKCMVSYYKFTREAAKHLDIPVGKCYLIPRPHYEHDKLCLLRAAFACKNSRVQYEVRTFYSYMNFHRLTGSTADTFLEYIERNLPEGIALKITKVEVRKLPEEITYINTSPDATKSPESGSDSSDTNSRMQSSH